MPRPRKNDPTPLLKPLLLDFARQIASAAERITLERVRQVLEGARGRRVRLKRSGPAARCYFPGCKNTAAPRFGMFCAALHKNISAAEKAKYRAARGKNGKRAKRA